MTDGGYVNHDPYSYDPNGSINWVKSGLVNSGYNAPSLNVNSIPNQNTNTWSDPSGPAPNFNGNTSVDTASLSAFGDWVSSELTESLQQLKPQLQGVQVEPGSFYWADYIRSYVNGTTPATGLRNQFLTVVEEMLDGLTGFSSGIDQLVQLYANTEDLNQADASKLESDMSSSFSNATGYFNHVLSDSQASGGSSGGGSGSSSGSSSSGSSSSGGS